MASNPKLRMDRRLYEAAQSDNVEVLEGLAADDRGVLLGTTPAGNSCLHIATMCGRQDFALRVISLAPELLADTNSNDETPLIVAAACRQSSLASSYLREVSNATPAGAADDVTAWGGSCQSEALVLKADKRGDTALHHAIRNRLDVLAVALLVAEPRLSEKVNDNGESPLFMAASRGLGGVVDELLYHPKAETGGPRRDTALHRAMFLQDTDLVEKILKQKPGLASAQNAKGTTPLHQAVNLDKPEMVKLLLKHDPIVAYVTNYEGVSAFALAAKRGHVNAAKAIVDHSPDSAYLVDDNKMTALHNAIQEGRAEFVKFVLGTPQLHGLLSQRSGDGSSALHFAVEKGDPEIIRSLLKNDADVVAVNVECRTALDILFNNTESIDTLKWNEVFTLLFRDDAISRISKVLWAKAERSLEAKTEKRVDQLMDTYRRNTTVVATLIAAGTLSASFAVSGGYNSNQRLSAGWKTARTVFYSVFLVADTVALCCSLAVAFFSILARSADLTFLLEYKKHATRLIRLAYCSTAVAFATGMYTMAAPGGSLQWWFAVVVGVLAVVSCAFPILPYFLGELPIRKLRERGGPAFRSDLIKKF